jgi:hypothetical protein
MNRLANFFEIPVVVHLLYQVLQGAGQKCQEYQNDLCVERSQSNVYVRT